MIIPIRYWMPTTLWSSEYRKYLATPGAAASASSRTAGTGRDHLPQQVVEYAEAGQPADDPER